MFFSYIKIGNFIIFGPIFLIIIMLIVILFSFKISVCNKIVLALVTMTTQIYAKVGIFSGVLRCQATLIGFFRYLSDHFYIQPCDLFSWLKSKILRLLTLFHHAKSDSSNMHKACDLKSTQQT